VKAARDFVEARRRHLALDGRLGQVAPGDAAMDGAHVLAHQLDPARSHVALARVAG